VATDLQVTSGLRLQRPDPLPVVADLLLAAADLLLVADLQVVVDIGHPLPPMAADTGLLP
jgi:hypothetical protein